MTDFPHTQAAIDVLGFMPLHHLELWGQAPLTLPQADKSVRMGDTLILAQAPQRWWLEGDVAAIAKLRGEHGALTEISGGVQRIRIAHRAWREILMEEAFYDFESPDFALGDCVTTLIHHVRVTIRVDTAQSCIAYVPASLAQEMLEFWQQVARDIR